MKGIIIYKGKYGATARYAAWLAEALGWPYVTCNEIRGKALQDYNPVIIGSSVYIGKLQVKKWMAENAGYLQNRKLFMFQVAGTPPEKKEKRMESVRSSVPASLLNSCPVFFLPGRLVIEKLSWWDRFMLKTGARLTKDPEEKKTMLQNYDHVNIENLEPLMEAVRHFTGKSEPSAQQPVSG